MNKQEADHIKKFRSKKTLMTSSEIKEKNNINRLAKKVQDVCKKDNGEFADYSIYQNYMIRLFAFGVDHKFNNDVSFMNYKLFIRPRFLRYCLDYRKLNRFYIIDDAVRKDFERSDERKRILKNE